MTPVFIVRFQLSINCVEINLVPTFLLLKFSLQQLYFELHVLVQSCQLGLQICILHFLLVIALSAVVQLFPQISNI